MKNKFLFLIILTQLCIVLPLACWLNLNADEASFLFVTEDTLSGVWQNQFILEKHSPLYFLLLDLWRMLGNSIFFTRLFSVLCISISVFIFSRLTAKLFDDTKALIVSAILAFHPYLLWTSLEINVYAPLILVSVLLIRSAWEIFGENNTDGWQCFLFILTSIAAVYLNFSLIFLITGIFMAAIIPGYKNLKLSFFPQFGLIFLSAIPLIILIFSTKKFGEIEIVGLFAGGKILWGYFLSFILPLEPFSPSSAIPGAAVRHWIVRFGFLILAILLLKNNFGHSNKGFIFGIISFVTALYFSPN